ncbi:BREX system P-loop protein BrxC [Shewanella sp. SG41-4]|uniref:BREX system P-loop protein BrxC n=1 Tax=Shewanella sp. SG41-4 TaxID=2760976 RepID=UPI0021758148|nr:BREX system P-loop protein BrxC [Shewanella sp. SG41-4]
MEHIFTKPVDRAIEGVIKADDDFSLFVELDEYVITKEVAKRLDKFLDAYLNYSGANGVWISGFFGSGKSHLLKMLALLLQNKPIEDVWPLELFLDKPPFNEGGMPANDLKRAVAIPSESILFNIDQKADVISKTELDALVAVFLKVFDEHCGYYGKQPYIAQFERELDADDYFVVFKETFESITGMPWDKGRQRAKRMAQNIDKAYNQVTGSTESNILDKYRDDYRLSIEDFASQVNGYIESKGDTFRLNFFVDEVGQYIADNVKLMTNLQTVAESLATKCKGRSWVIVTAQEEMASVIGEDGAHTSHDFSKIQARFKNRMKLNSQDVAEVIQMRLLHKKEDYISQLSDLYHKQENNLKTLFDFADGSASYPNYKDREHFIKSYPFVPYQFMLFQASIQNLSRHNAFEGKHSSVGERSMLGVFQQVAIGIKDHTLGDLATFDLMFEGIRTALKGAIQASILKAEKILTNPFALRVLKALFLVKYVKEFKPSIRNICVLMQDNFDVSLSQLKADVEEALGLLEQQTYIQRNGDLYEYLTDEEQDVEAEIKNTDVDTSAVSTELEKLIYDGIIKNRKIRWDESGQDYAFTRKLDDNQSGREHELAIHIITSFHDHRDALEKHRTDTVYNDELRVVLPESARLMSDLLLYLQTQKYVSHETRTTQQDSVKRILADKAGQNADRYNQLKLLLSKLMGQATYFVAGKEIELSGEDGQSKVIKAFIELVKHTYPNLRMLRGQQYTEADISKILTEGQQGLFGDEQILPESLQEMFSFIQRNSNGGIRTTVKLVQEKFERKSYGWSYAATLCTLAHLCARGKIEVRESTNLLDDSELLRALKNAGAHGNLILDPQVEFTPSQIRKLKEFFNDYFDKVALSNEAKALAKETQEAFFAQKTELVRLHDQAPKYSFLRALTAIIADLSDLEAKPYPWFITELTREEDKWLENYKDRVIDPITKFMKGQSKKHLDDAMRLLEEHKANLSYVQADELAAIQAAVVEPNIYKGDAVQQLVANMKSLKSKIEAELQNAQTQAEQKIAQIKEKLLQINDYAQLTPEQQASINAAFEAIKSKLVQQTLIALVRDNVRQFEDTSYPQLLDKILLWTAPKPVMPEKPAQPVVAKPGIPPAPAEVKEPSSPAYQTVAIRDIQVAFNKPLLDTEADVDAYIDSYKAKLIEMIKQGKKVRV